MSGTAQQAKALTIRFPNDGGKYSDGTARNSNDFGVSKIALTSTHSQYQFPNDWSGRIVHMFPDTAAVYPQVAFSTSSGREVDTASAAASNNATSSKAGMPLPPQQITPVQLPKWDRGNQSGYLIGESATNTTVYIWLADGY